MEWTEAQLDAIRNSQRWRTMLAYDGLGPLTHIDGEPMVSFASNDYLGLSHHPDVQAAAIDAIERLGTGSGASRLVTGTRGLHLQLEHALARWQRTESALVFSTGFAANLAALSVFGTDGATILSDELNHASIVDGCRFAKAQIKIYLHRDVDHLAALLQQTPGRKLVVSDTVFSMDGDVAPFEELA
jgi:8-amino-7-oxononanoate synthase